MKNAPVSIHQSTRTLEKLADRIFISAVVGQVVLILVIFLLGLGAFVWNAEQDTLQKISSNMNEWSSSITEAVYVNSKTQSFRLEELPILSEFQKALMANGIEASVRVAECGRPQDREVEYPLRIGELALDHCVYAAPTESFALRGVLFGFALAVLSLLLSVTGWMFWRGRFKRRILEPLVESLERDARDAAVGKMASQIAHDIRSPLAALNIFMKDPGSMSEDRRVLLRSAITRIQDISNNILPAKQKKNVVSIESNLQMRTDLVTSLIETIVTEKRLQYRDAVETEIFLRLDKHSYGAFARVDFVEFQRVISNLIDNAVESLRESRGRVAVLVETLPEEVKISIVDNGRGIPADILPRLMVKGASFGKEGGSGLGLAHAKSQVEAWGGRIHLESRVGEGTKVSVILRRERAPKWFLEFLPVRSRSQVVVLDDDPSIHQIWIGRFQSSIPETNRPSQMLRFTSLVEADAYFNEKTLAEVDLFLVDYEFIGSKENGLSWIMRHNLASKSVLVTSRYEEPSIRSLCERIGLKLLPKGLAAYLPIGVDGVIVQEEVESTWARALP